MTRGIDRNPDAEFTPAVLFLSTASPAESDLPPGDEPHAIQTQREAGHHKASALSVGIIKEFVELGTPATALKRRPRLREMFRYLRQHPEVRIVIFPKRERFARDFSHATNLRQRFEKLDVDVVFTGDSDDRLPNPADIFDGLYRWLRDTVGEERTDHKEATRSAIRRHNAMRDTTPGVAVEGLRR